MEVLGALRFPRCLLVLCVCVCARACVVYGTVFLFSVGGKKTLNRRVVIESSEHRELMMSG